MKSLVADDDFIVRKIMQDILSSYGECHIAANGNEALLAFKMALEVSNPYDLVCLDIMMPEINGQETLTKIREIEKKRNTSGVPDVKIIMITSKEDTDNIKGPLLQDASLT